MAVQKGVVQFLYRPLLLIWSICYLTGMLFTLALLFGFKL